jgi:tryptophan synthase alpha chain
MIQGKERIDAAFSQGKRPLLVAFTVAGDPDFGSSLSIMREMAASGADIIELVLPFSDPVADGPVIQRADIRAMDAGMNTDRLYELVREFRAGSSVPVVILTYANLVMRRGILSFYQQAARAGIDGVVIADVPCEESDPFIQAAEETGISQIMLVSTTTSPERLEKIIGRASGFIYLVAVMGVTGARTGVDPAAIGLLKTVREKTSVPVAPGFGISSPGQVRIWAEADADAVIVGSAIVKKIEENLDNPERIATSVGEFIRDLKNQ